MPSKGELLLIQCYKRLHLKYKLQVKFPDLKNIRSLRIDSMCVTPGGHSLYVEYDGRQHIESVAKFKGDKGLIKCRQHDQIKNDYFRANNLHFLRVPHIIDKYDDVEKILNIAVNKIDSGEIIYEIGKTGEYYSRVNTGLIGLGLGLFYSLIVGPIIIPIWTSVGIGLGEKRQCCSRWLYPSPLSFINRTNYS